MKTSYSAFLLAGKAAFQTDGNNSEREYWEESSRIIGTFESSCLVRTVLCLCLFRFLQLNKHISCIHSMCNYIWR